MITTNELTAMDIEKAKRDAVNEQHLTSQERFEIWWRDEGSGMPPRDGEDAEEHAKRIARIAWVHGAYVDREKKLVPGDDSLTRWLIHGERGYSSEAIVFHIMRLSIKNKAHPLDPDDFRRCRLLVEQVPYIRANLPSMSTCSEIWANIIAAWDELCRLMDAEAPQWREGLCTAPQTYELLKRCRMDILSRDPRS